MSTPLLEQENQRLSAENETLTDENDTLTAKVKDMEDTFLSPEDQDSLNVELTELKDSVKNLGDYNNMKANLELALNVIRDDYKRAFTAACGATDPTEEELQTLDDELKNTTSAVVLQAGIKRLQKQSRENKINGRKSAVAGTNNTKVDKPNQYKYTRNSV